jgi:hypothetical protein
MTTGELEILRLKLSLEVHRVLLRGLYIAAANSIPGGAQACRDRFAALRKEHAKIVIPGIPPEYSDMVTAEYQEALEDALSSIEAGFRS